MNTIHKRLLFYFELAKKADNIENKQAIVNQALGASEIAVEFGLITYRDFEKYIHHIFKMIYGQ